VKRGRGFVAGHGVPNARLIVLGEAPGSHEIGACDCTNHEKGQPFVGPSGNILNNAIGGRGDVFITNVRKCIPPEREARKDQEDSISHCVREYLDKELAAFGGECRHMLLVGGEALQTATGQYRISRLHGSVWTVPEVNALRGELPRTVAPDFLENEQDEDEEGEE
jgi:uracil-DNA glycosylase family 4